MNTQVGGGFAGSYFIGSVNGPVDGGKQRELLTGAATREFGLGRPDSAGVESDDVEVRDDFIGEQAERNAIEEIYTARTRTSGIHE